MGSYDGLPSLVAEMRQMKSRLGELERQQLGATKDLAELTNAALTKTAIFRAQSGVGATFSPNAPIAPSDFAVVADMEVSFDPMGLPLMISCVLPVRAADATSGTVDVYFHLWCPEKGLAVLEQFATLSARQEYAFGGTASWNPALLPTGTMTLQARAMYSPGSAVPYSPFQSRSINVVRFGVPFEDV